MPKEVISRAQEILSVKESGQKLRSLHFDSMRRKTASIKDCLELLSEVDHPQVCPKDQIKKIEKILINL